MPPSEPATRRLALYCKRAARGPYDFVERRYGTERQSVRRVKYVNRELREIVWRDTEVRDLLLQDDAFTALTHGLRHHHGDVLDLMCAMSLEAERRPAT